MDFNIHLSCLTSSFQMKYAHTKNNNIIIIKPYSFYFLGGGSIGFFAGGGARGFLAADVATAV